MSNTESAPRSRIIRFIRFVVFFSIIFLLFVGGSTALLYLLFSQYTGIQNIWLLVSGTPFVVGPLLIFTILNLYTRFGKPLKNIFKFINSNEAGVFSVHVDIM